MQPAVPPLAQPVSLFRGVIDMSSVMSIWQNGAGMRWFLLGTLVETGRRVWTWFIERFQFQYSITAQFTEGDPAYQWIILFLTKQQIYQHSRNFRVTAASSILKWSIKLKDTSRKPIPSPIGKSVDSLSDGHAEYVPTYEAPQLFIWKGHLLEVKRNRAMTYGMHIHPGAVPNSMIYLTIYTRNMGILSSLVDEANALYRETSKPHVLVHTVDQPSFGATFMWSQPKRKNRRPLSSIVLPEGVIQSLLSDIHEFFAAEEWYARTGIPHRRGYLLYGPPGCGKTSTIYAIASELNLEIYSVSLAANFVDDSFLERAVASIPKKAIFLIEDIDCAFPPPSSDSDDGNNSYANEMAMMFPGSRMGGRGRRGARLMTSQVTLSGLLNVLDGVGSEEGKLFFATTNHIEYLDPALMRPGRIDMKVEYKLAERRQAEALFVRFYPADFVSWDGILDGGVADVGKKDGLVVAGDGDTEAKEANLRDLAATFAAQVPPDEFSTAELQGYLLGHKKSPHAAAHGIRGWVQKERAEKAALEKKKEEEESKREKKVQKSKDAKPGNLSDPNTVEDQEDELTSLLKAIDSASRPQSPPRPPSPPSIPASTSPSSTSILSPPSSLSPPPPFPGTPFTNVNGTTAPSGLNGSNAAPNLSALGFSGAIPSSARDSTTRDQSFAIQTLMSQIQLMSAQLRALETLALSAVNAANGTTSAPTLGTQETPAGIVSVANGNGSAFVLSPACYMNGNGKVSAMHNGVEDHSSDPDSFDSAGQPSS